MGIATESEGEIAVEIALVNFIEDHQPDPGQFGIALQAPGEDPFGDDFDPRRPGDLALKTDGVADPGADTFAELRRQIVGGIGRRQPPRFEDNHRLSGEPRRVEKFEGDARRLPRPRRGLQHAGRRCGQQSLEAGEDLVNRQGVALQGASLR